MDLRRKDDWARDINERQANHVFPDTSRNLGSFWRGLYSQKLGVGKWIGLIGLLLFYIAFFVGVALQQWPRGPGSVWEKLFYGYGVYVLFFVPLIALFLVLRHSLRRMK